MRNYKAPQTISHLGLKKVIESTKSVDKILCACGCGTLRDRIDKWGEERRFIAGHTTKLVKVRKKIGDRLRGISRSEAVKENLRKIMKGEGNPMFGKSRP